jgi:hypothetical protein
MREKKCKIKLGLFSTYILLNLAVRTDPFGNAIPNNSVVNEASGESGGSFSFSSP